MASAWQEVCDLAVLEPGWGRAALVGTEQVALFRSDGDQVLAVSNRDPKTGAMVISRGIVGRRTVAGEARDTIASPLHKDVFDLRTGACYTSSDYVLPVWRARVHEGRVQIAPPAELVLASHGTRSAEGAAAISALTRAVRAELAGHAVHDCFVDVQDPDVPTVLEGVDADAVVVPLLLSAGYHVHVDLADAASGHGAAVVTRALGPDAALVDVLVRRLREAGWEATDAVVLAAAGSSDPRAVEDCRRAAAMLGEALGTDVLTGFVSGSLPRLGTAIAEARSGGSRVALASYLLAPGTFHGELLASGADVVSAPLLADDEPPAELVRLVRQRHAEGLASLTPGSFAR
ncbi:nitrite reductase small subunit NirD [Microbacterium sp. SORGH_AS_0888]|uniref:nitrite reductase small subunit NirD n=1 Tax=Microbacterium sp. SORGH_AS_0888 TaxID=3041791 RepID=UPI002786DCAF|nr:nitrite reductase small subunit NirD [Microbacterium sp. SORGH_AS_0888]MDQ1130360.1 NAD(P)H-dependent nitrite reductase small subunit [Microbacterium sp. SORGH_AS_0888]